MIKFSLDEVMKERNLTIQDVMNATGITRPTIAQLSNGKAKGIQFDTLNRLIDGLGLEADELFETVYPKNDLVFDVSLDPDYLKLIGSYDEPVVYVKFFHNQNINEEYSVAAFTMPLSVSFKKVDDNDPKSNTIVLISCTLNFLDDLDMSKRSIQDLKDYLNRTTSMDLDLALGTVVSNVIEKVKLQSPYESVVFRSDISSITTPDIWNIMFSWPSALLRNTDMLAKYVTSKYTF